MDRIYGATELGCPYRTEPALYEMEEGESVYNLDGQDVTLSEEQRKAVDLGTSTLPIEAHSRTMTRPTTTPRSFRRARVDTNY
ncbi:hypothetical protein Aduo_001190 [Ancylostoma duodenale]